MKILLASLCLCAGFISKAAWTNLNTGISDDLTGVVFWGTNGLVSGHQGLYYTTTGGVGSASWTHFTISGNLTDSTTYSHTRFSHAFASSPHTDYAFACGQDTVNDVAVIFQFHIPTQAYQILYQGAANTKLNNIRYSYESNQYYAVGDNGLVVRFNLGITGFAESSGGGIDYESVYFSGARVSVGTTDYKTYGLDNDPGLNLTSYSASGKHIKDYWQISTYNAYAVGNAVYSLNYLTGNLITLTNYNFGPLNANSMYRLGSFYFVGTDHGIFRFTNPNTVEWQPSSLQHFIYEFWNQSASYPLYACGKNGVVLSTTDNGGTPLPYMSVSESGGCKGQILEMTGTYGSATTCQWYLNGSLVSSSCSNYAFIGNTTGLYEIKFKGTNSAGTDSALTSFYVVDTPDIDLPFILNDTILCKKQPVIIEIDQSQDNVYYELSAAVGGAGYGISPEGDGGLISFTTDSISQGGGYILEANSTLAACSIKFTDTIDMDVEHTKAAYHVSKTNLVPGEEMQLFETCLEASNYSWEFPPGSMYSVSNLANPLNSFSNAGNQQIKLLCWSDNFCYDSITGPGPAVYIPPAMYDSCWVNLSSGDDPQWLGYYFDEISDLTPLNDGGYLISGTFHDHSFATTYGDSLQRDWFGSYLCRYDKNGVYKWNVHSVGAGNAYTTAGTNINKFSIRSTAVDADGNIYGCGYFQNYYVDNAGDTIPTPGGFGQIFKLDSLGKTIWQRTADELYPTHIAIDHSGSIVVTARRNDNYSDGIKLFLNGVITDTMIAPVMGNYGLTKFAPDGTFIWDIPIQMNHTNTVDLLGVKFDNQDNLYLTGCYEYNATIYSTGITGVVNNTSTSTYGRKLLLAKINSEGMLQWLTRSYSNTIGADRTQPHDISIDDAGNCYISGENYCYIPSVTHNFENTDGTITSHSGGRYFVTKVDSSGKCQWINGGYSAYYGYAYENDLVGDTLFVLGMLRQNGPIYTTIHFYNPDSSAIHLDIAASDYIVGVYDTSGYIHRVVKNGDNAGQLDTDSFTGFHKAADGTFYAARNGNGMSSLPSDPYTDFGDTISTMNGDEGWVTRFCLNCGIVYEAGFQQITDTTVCIGSSYTFPDGNTITGIMNEMHDTIMLNSISGMDSLIITNIYVNGYLNLVDSVSVCYDQSYTFPDGVTLNNITTLTTHENMFQTMLGCDSILTTVVTPIPPTLNPVDSASVCYNSSYTCMDGFVLTNITAPTTHDNYFTTTNGCDSIIQTTVYPFNAIDTTITFSATQMVSNHPSNPGVTYQWYDCLAGYIPVAGETNPDYTPLSDGSYAVNINDNGCSEMSACHNFFVSGVDEYLLEVIVYPNPTDGQVYVSFKNVSDYTDVRVLNALGQEVLRLPVLTPTMVIALPEADGIYYLRFISADKPQFTKIITKN